MTTTSNNTNNSSNGGGGSAGAGDDDNNNNNNNNKPKVVLSRTTSTSRTEEMMMMDITSLVDACAASLSYTNPMLCNDSSFNLQDSMAAMELLDKKMDSCEIPASQILLLLPPNKNTTINNNNNNSSSSANNNNSSSSANNNNNNDNDEQRMLYPRPPPTKLDDDFLPLPWNELTLRDSVWIAVEGLVRLESMLGGSSVVESIYTCLYTPCSVIEDMKHRLDLQEVLPLLPTTTTEDGTDRSNLLLSTPPPTTTTTKSSSSSLPPSRRGTLAQHIVYATTLALVEITEILRSIILHGDIYEEEDFCANAYNVAVYSNHESNNTLSELTYALKLAEEMYEKDSTTDEALAAQHILGFLIEFLGISSSLARVAGSEVMRVMVETQQAIRTAVENLDDLQSLYKKLRATETSHDVQLIRRTFDPFANRPLFGNSPVRKVVFLKPEESLALLSKIVKEIDWGLCQLVVRGFSLSRIRRYLDRISKASINVLTRSLIVLNLYFDEKLLGRHSLLELIMKDLQEMAAVPDDIFESKNGQIFMNRLAKPIYDTLKLRLLNRSRQRAYMEAVIIHDWSQLQQEAHVVDVHYRKEKGLDNTSPPYISHYVLYNLIQIMDLHVSIGVELSLFRSHEELAVMYWYRDFLLSTALNNMAAMKKSKEAEKEFSGRKSKGKKKNQNKKEKNGTTTQPSRNEYDSNLDFMALQCKRSLCRGLVRYIAALHQAKVLKKDKFQFTTSEKVFQKRFEAFAVVQQPPPLSYDDFVQGSSFERVSQDDLFFSTAECFKSSKTTIGRITAALASTDSDFFSMTHQELTQISKVCVGNSIYIAKLKQFVGQKETNDGTPPAVEFDFSTNNEFPIVKLD